MNTISDRQVKELVKYIRLEKANGTPNSQIVEAIEARGVSQFQAQHLVENTEQILNNNTGNQQNSNTQNYLPGEAPNMVLAILGTIIGVIALIAGIAIIVGSDGQFITYGLVLVGALWTIRGFSKIAAAAANRR